MDCFNERIMRRIGLVKEGSGEKVIKYIMI